MPGYDCCFVEKLQRRVYCPLCNLPMRDPVQITSCRHRFCDTCLQEFLRWGAIAAEAGVVAERRFRVRQHHCSINGSVCCAWIPMFSLNRRRRGNVALCSTVLKANLVLITCAVFWVSTLKRVMITSADVSITFMSIGSFLGRHHAGLVLWREIRSVRLKL